MSDGPAPDGAEDARFMARALELAERGYYTARPNPRVGCVIVRSGRIVGEGYHARAGQPHAEINALADAGDASGATAYVTLEPCCHHGRTPPCTDALVDAQVARVVYAAADPNPRVAGGGAVRLREAGIDVRAGVLEAPAERLNRGFFRRMQRGVPFVTVKLGMSFDSKVALASGESQWITSPEARSDVQRLRAAAGAIVTGRGTVAADDPRLTVRDSRFGLDDLQPLRVVCDSGLTLSPAMRVFERATDALVFTASDDRGRRQQFDEARVEVVNVAAGADGLDLARILEALAGRGVNDVLVEAGPTLAGAFIRGGLADEIVAYVAPAVIGTDARDAFSLAAPRALEDVHRFEFVDVRNVGPDLRVTLAPVRAAT